MFGGGDAKEGFNDVYMLHDVFEKLSTKEVPSSPGQSPDVSPSMLPANEEVPRSTLADGQ